MPHQPSIGVNLRVTGHCNQGGRRYMEDAFAVAYQQTGEDLEYAYFGIFDGHGGREAALFAKEHLMNAIVANKNFLSEDDDLVLKSIKDGFLATHAAMWKQVSNWPQTVSGLPSTSGTTASVIFIRKGKMYIGHVGDSAIVLGYKDSDGKRFGARPLTSDHKPESPTERQRIENVGGCVMSKCGVQRVVWNRPRIGHKGPVRRSTHIDQIPFLAVARSLGDLWSYDYLHGQFIVSPEPDVHVVTLDPRRDRCIVLATDGVWNMVSYEEAVHIVEAAEYENERQFFSDDTRQIGFKPWVNPSKLLVERALGLWMLRKKRADNTSVVTVMLDPPGPSRGEVLRRRRMIQKLRPRDETGSSSSIDAGGRPSTSRVLVTSSDGGGGGGVGNTELQSNYDANCRRLPPKMKSHVIDSPTMNIPAMAVTDDDERMEQVSSREPIDSLADTVIPASLPRTVRCTPHELTKRIHGFASCTDDVSVVRRTQRIRVSASAAAACAKSIDSLRRIKRKLPLPPPPRLPLRTTRTVGHADKRPRLFHGRLHVPDCYITRSRMRLGKVQA